jgi:hypothetical protein
MKSAVLRDGFPQLISHLTPVISGCQTNFWHDLPDLPQPTQTSSRFGGRLASYARFDGKPCPLQQNHSTSQYVRFQVHGFLMEWLQGLRLKRMSAGFPVCLESTGFRRPGGFPPPLGQGLMPCRKNL